MIAVPDELRELFRQDSIPKNFRITFPNHEYRDLVNADLVSESVVFTDSAMSSSEFKFGLCESGIIEFSMYFAENIKGLTISCFIEIDISTLSQDIQDTYGQTSDDVPYVYYRVPYGYFTVQSCTKQGKTGIQKVIGYNELQANGSQSNYLTVPTVYSGLLKFGKTYYNNSNSNFSADNLRFIFGTDPFISSALLDNVYLDGQARLLEDEYTQVTSHQFSTTDFTVKDKDGNEISGNHKTGILTPIVDIYHSTIPIQSGAGEIYIYLRCKCFYISSSESSSTPFTLIQNDSNTYITSTLPTSSRVSNTVKWHIVDDDYADKGLGYHYVYWNTNKSMNKIIDSVYSSIASAASVNVDYIKHGREDARGIPYEELRRFLTPCIRILDAPMYHDYETCVDDNTVALHKSFPCEAAVYSDNAGINYDSVNYSTRTIHINMGGSYDDVSGRYHVTIPCGLLSFLHRYTCDTNANNVDIGELHDTHKEVFYNDNGNLHIEEVPNTVAICIPDYIILAVPRVDGATFPYSEYSKYRFDSVSLYNRISSSSEIIPTYRKYELQLLNGSEPPKGFEYPYGLQCELTKTGSTEYILEGDRIAQDNTHVIYEKRYPAVKYSCNDTIDTVEKTRQLLSSWAELQGSFLRYDKYIQHKLTLVKLNIINTSRVLLPSETLYPYDYRYPGDYTGLVEIISRSDWRNIFSEDNSAVAYSSILYNGVNYENSTLSKYTASYYIKDSGIEYDMTSNYLLTHLYTGKITIKYKYNTAYSEEFYLNPNYILGENVAPILKSAYLIKLNATIRALPFLESLDPIIFMTKDDAIITNIYSHRITGIQSLIDNITSL